MKNLLAGCAAVAALSMGASAQAAVIGLDGSGTWHVQDQIMNVGDTYNDIFVALSDLTVRFTDLYVQGDTYSIYVNGAFQFTSVDQPHDGTFISDPQTAFDSGKYSFGTLSVLAGDVISFTANTIPQGYSDGTLAVSGFAAGVPEPATWALMIGGFGLAGVSLRRRATRVAA